MGRTAIFMVLGLCGTLIVMGPMSARYANEAVENFIVYYNRGVVHNIALAGANIGANKVFLDPTWNAGYSNIKFAGGTFSVTAGHLVAPADTSRIQIISTAVLDTMRDTVKVLLEPSSFSKFAVYLKTMSSVNWATGDTVWGPCHIDAQLRYSGNPVFWGKTTDKSGKTGTGNPQFYGGYQSGVSVPLPFDLGKTTNGATLDGRIMTTPSGSGQFEVRITFNSNGTLNYADYKNGARVDTFSNVVDTVFAHNGVIWVQNGSLKVKGTFKGKLTITATGTGNGNSGSQNGWIYIMGDLQAASDPRTNPFSQDMLGVVADVSISVANLSPVKHDYLLQAALFCRTGGFFLNSTSSSSNGPISSMGLQGAVSVLGSLTSTTIGAFGHFNGSGVLDYGYRNYFGFDNRFYTQAPPYYPNSGTYQTISWRE